MVREVLPAVELLPGLEDDAVAGGRWAKFGQVEGSETALAIDREGQGADEARVIAAVVAAGNRLPGLLIWGGPRVFKFGVAF